MTATYLVAVTRWVAHFNLEQELPELAAVLGLGLYDARVRLSAPLPLIVGTRFSAVEARALLERLRGRGHGAIGCDSDRLPDADTSTVARTFELQPEALLLTDTGARTLALPYAQILGLVRAAEITDEIATVEVKRKELSLGRAALTGGLMRRKEVTATETHASADRQEALYLFCSTSARPIVLRERELHYHDLGEQRGLTRRQSFLTLVQRLRASAPNAMYDERLLTQKRRSELASVDGDARRRTMTSTNSSANQVAAYLLMHAHLQGQL